MYQFSFNTEINWFQLNVQDDDVNIQKKRISYMYAQSHHERSISNYQSSISNYQSWVHYKKDANWPTKKKEIDWTTTPDFPYRKLRDLHNTLSFFFLRICKPLNDQLFCNLFNRFAGKTGKPYQWLASVHFTWEKKGHPIQYAKNNLSNNHFTLFLNNKMIYLKVLNSKQIFFALKKHDKSLTLSN